MAHPAETRVLVAAGCLPRQSVELSVMYRSDVPLTSVAAGASAATFLFMSVFIGVGDASAENTGLPGTSVYADAAPFPLPSARREAAAIPPYMAPPEPGDSTAALEAVEIALTQASDGATYVWRRHNGRLAGAFRPTSTFRDVDGRMCRHLEMHMRLGTYQRRTEGIACRSSDGVWNLEG
jgi:hypothetical protein